MLKLGQRVKTKTSDIIGIVWCLSQQDNTCIVRHEKTNGKIWISL